MVATSVRNASLADLAELLKDQHAAKVDVVAPATSLRMDGGVLTVSGAEPVMDASGVTLADGKYLPTAVFDEGVADKLKIPVGYLRRMRNERPDLYDANVNGWLHGDGGEVSADDRSFLVRCFTGGDTGLGVARALLSDKYARIDNFDVLTSALAGVRDAGANVTVESCDLTDRRMMVRIVAPEVQAVAETLLRDYRSPFRDPEVDAQRHHGFGAAMRAMETWGAHSGAVTDPVVFAGFVLTNSEVGGGAFTITPRIVFRVCNNGATMNVDALRAVHLGSKMEEGVVRWTEDTQRKALDLIAAKTRDAVATFLDEDYLVSCIGRIEAQCEARVADPVKVVQQVGKKLSYDEDTIAGVLDHFIRGGCMTAGGVLNAVTSYAQVVPDADKAHDLEGTALRALELAAAA